MASAQGWLWPENTQRGWDPAPDSRMDLCQRASSRRGGSSNSQQAEMATNQTPSSLLKKAANCISQSAFSLLQGTPPCARRMVAHPGIFFQPKLLVPGAASTGEGAGVPVQKVEQQVQPNGAGNDRAGFSVNTEESRWEVEVLSCRPHQKNIKGWLMHLERNELCCNREKC